MKPARTFPIIVQLLLMCQAILIVVLQLTRKDSGEHNGLLSLCVLQMLLICIWVAMEFGPSK